ncbi:hypothetical protein IB633_00365 [Francisella philomiragia]|nr:hypothetical protein [Francisella philomiragia]AJI46774.1 hypothetical protein BF30_423 [Francisella philomiragia]AJI50111.1 hypothetical protein KU46_1129 [Francisella philomiragia]MBK2020102.1 hypothetical protein [Francisella philomiragia]MBK2029564.1 hypothetical protein [Francisella philomiragia]MBK2263360.1 hypothetical protein [Francisella philomiragia]
MRKAVIYMQGFDPRGQKFYKRTFRNELNKYSKITNIPADINSKKKDQLEIFSQDVSTDLFFLDWQEIINLVYYKSGLTAWFGSLIGSLMFFLKISPVKNTARYLIILHALTVFDFLIFIIGIVIFGSILMYHCNVLSLLVILILFILLTKIYLLLRSRIGNNKIRVWCQSFIYLYYFSKKNKHKFIDISKKHARELKNILEAKHYDEVILYSHSAGSLPLLFLLQEADKKLLTNIKIVIAGHCMPCYMNFKHLKDLKQNLVKLINYYNLQIFDLYSPIDIVSSKLSNNLVFKSINLSSYNSQFYKMYTKESYEKIKKDLFSIHFQYILAGEKPLNKLNFYRILTDSSKLETI